MFRKSQCSPQPLLRRLKRVHFSSFILSALLGLLGLVLRLYDIGYPDSLTFDEHHFVKNAHNYLRGAADWNDHPPLGKLSFALSWKYISQSLWGMRLVSVVAGLGTCALGGFIATRLFHSRRAGILAFALLASDGFLIAFSRVALLDMQLVFSGALACALIVTNKGWSRALASVVIGLTMAIKLSGVILVAPLIVAPWLLASQSCRKGQLLHQFFSSVFFCCVILLVYLSVWALGLSLSGQLQAAHWWSPWSEAWAGHQRMFLHHRGLNDWQHPMLSPFYEWPLPTRPLVHFLLRLPDGRYRVLLGMGNPLSWWLAWAVMLWAALRIFVGPLRVLREACQVPGRGAQLFLLVGFCAALSPWVLTDRDSYIYHFLPAYFFALVLLAGQLSQILQSSKRWLTPLLLACILLLSSFYAPLWCGYPLSRSQVRARPYIKLGPWQGLKTEPSSPREHGAQKSP